MNLPNPSYWRDRRVLLTGHTGFKGSWLTAWLRRLGAEVLGISLAGVPTSPRMWDELGLNGVRDVDADLAQSGRWESEVRSFEPTVVLHLAAQAFVPLGFREPLRTVLSNTVATARILDVVAGLDSVEVCLVITTDKVYDPRQEPPHAEEDFLGGLDPYSASKAAAELLVNAWPRGNTAVATARAGNVIGGGDSSADRLLPDVLSSWEHGNPVRLRSPRAVRPWQHVLQPLHGYLLYVERLARDADAPLALNFGPDVGQNVQVVDVVNAAAELWEEHDRVVPDPPYLVTPEPTMVESKRLEIDSERARQTLGWGNVMSWREAVEWTVEWRQQATDGVSVSDLVESQLARYEALVGRP